MQRRKLLLLGAILSTLPACASSGIPTMNFDQMSFVVEVRYVGINKIEDVLGKSDSEFPLINQKSLDRRGGGQSTYLAGSKIKFPKWVDFSWKEPPAPGGKPYTGESVGPFRVEVLSRIPKEAFELARQDRKRMLKLRFRIKDDEVLFGWAVENIWLADPIIQSGGDFP